MKKKVAKKVKTLTKDELAKKLSKLEKLIAAVRYLFSPKEIKSISELPFLTVHEMNFRLDILQQALKEYDEQGSEDKK